MKEIHYRSTFDNQAQLYQEVRPTYPESLFDLLVTETKLSPHAHLLEIGPGTGQATAQLAKRGYAITAVELGKELATVARSQLKQYPKVEVINEFFEKVQLPEESFDLVYAATAFHWIEPAVKFRKPHSLLKDGGYLAVIRTNHVLTDDTKNAFVAMQPIYEKYRGTLGKTERTQVTSIDDIAPDTFDEKLFQRVCFRVFPMRITYTTADYIKLLNTFSETIAMESEQRSYFLHEIANLIDTEFEGKIAKQFGMSLSVARKI